MKILLACSGRCYMYAAPTTGGAAYIVRCCACLASFWNAPPTVTHVATWRMGLSLTSTEVCQWQCHWAEAWRLKPIRCNWLPPAEFRTLACNNTSALSLKAYRTGSLMTERKWNEWKTQQKLHWLTSEGALHNPLRGSDLRRVLGYVVSHLSQT